MTRTRALAAAALGLLALGAVARWRWPDAGPAPSAQASVPASLDLNTATEQELARIPGVSRALAHRLVEARQSRGSFTSWDEVDAVPGVGAARLETLRAAAHIGPSPAP